MLAGMTTVTPTIELVWRSGILDALPPCIDHAVVGAAEGLGRNGWGAALLMGDVGQWLVPEGDTEELGWWCDRALEGAARL